MLTVKNAFDIRKEALHHAIRATKSTDTPQTVVEVATTFEAYLGGASIVVEPGAEREVVPEGVGLQPMTQSIALTVREEVKKGFQGVGALHLEPPEASDQ